MNTNVHNAAQTITDPKQALQYLKEGNKRFISGIMIHRKSDTPEHEAMMEGQNPFAAILACSDSRVLPGVIFD